MMNINVASMHSKYNSNLNTDTITIQKTMFIISNCKAKFNYTYEVSFSLTQN